MDQQISRIGYDEIVRLVPKGATVLDLGCAEGDLLHRLIQERDVHGDGVEIDYDKVLSCVGKGLSVYHGSIEDGLQLYDDKSFDYIILSETLQVLKEPLVVLRDMLRVGQRAIVSFPNFANWRLRCQLFFGGVMPGSKLLPFAWYDTPNIRHCTVKDFRNLCDDQNLTIEQTRYSGHFFTALNPNLLAELGIFVVCKNGKAE